MALSRTARILVALLLLAAAAFFWVNFFTQNRVLVEEPGTTPSAATAAPPTVVVPDAVDAESEPAVTDAATGDAAATVEDPDAAFVGTDEASTEPPEAEAADVDAAADPAAADAAAAATSTPVVVLDSPVTLSREVVVADLPFLVTSPPAPPEPETVDVAADVTERSLAAARATVNPFSPVVVRVAAAPPREVPTEAPVITEVAVPVEPAAAPTPAPRVAAPAPTVRAPAPTVVSELPRALPTGTPLAATPDILRQPRTVVERVEVIEAPVVRVPESEAARPAETIPAPRVTTSVGTSVPDVVGPGQQAEPVETTAVATPAVRPPLAAGTNPLTRYLRDNAYTFTGSALGPVSVGVFRSSIVTTPVVVAIGQTLPNTEIVLTDLRGQQAELTLDDTSQILVLDLRR